MFAMYKMVDGSEVKVLIVSSSHYGTFVKFFVRGFVPYAARPVLVDADKLTYLT